MPHMTYAPGSTLAREDGDFATFDICFTLAGE